MQEDSKNFVVLPYVSGLSEKISRELRKHDIKVAHKTINKINDMFPRPKGKKDVTLNTGVVYKIQCKDCNFVYYGQTERSLRTRLAVCQNAPLSKVAEHSNTQGHEMDFANTSIVIAEHDYHRRLFLEAWFSELDANSGNIRASIPTAYRSFIDSCKN